MREFVCNNCGTIANKWMGQCPACQTWSSLEERNIQSAPPLGNKVKRRNSVEPVRLTSLIGEREKIQRIPTGFSECDRVLGGGIVPGSAILIGGDPGIGKSTLLLQLLAKTAHLVPCAYISGEEGVDQIRMRAERLGVLNAPIGLASASEVKEICALMDEPNGPKLLVADSIQTLYVSEIEAAPGTVTQVRAAAQELIRAAKRNGCAIFIVGHVTRRMMRFERRADVSLPALVIAPFAAIVVALSLCAVLIAAAGVSPLTAYAEMLRGAYGSRLAVTETLTRATPLILTGLAAAVAFRAQLWNIGGEGQFYIGALVTAGLGHSLLAGLPAAAGDCTSDGSQHGGRRAASGRSGPHAAALRGGRSGDDAFDEFHRDPVCRPDGGRAAEGPDGLWLAAVGSGGGGAAAARSGTKVPPACGAAGGAGGSGAGLGRADANGLWRGNPCRRAEPARGGLCRCAPGPDADAGGRPVGGPRRACRFDRGAGPHRLCHHHHVAGLWLCRYRGGHAGGAASGRCGGGCGLRGHGLCRCRRHEPGHRRAQLHCRCHHVGLAYWRC